MFKEVPWSSQNPLNQWLSSGTACLRFQQLPSASTLHLATLHHFAKSAPHGFCLPNLILAVNEFNQALIGCLSVCLSVTLLQTLYLKCFCQLAKTILGRDWPLREFWFSFLESPLNPFGSSLDRFWIRKSYMLALTLSINYQDIRVKFLDWNYWTMLYQSSHVPLKSISF